MKRFVSLLSLCLLSLMGCDQSASEPEAETYAGYIFFAPQVETKATLIESAAGMKFGVVGFKYDNSLSWNDFKANLHTPNVFYDENGKNHKGEKLFILKYTDSNIIRLKDIDNNKLTFKPVDNGNPAITDFTATIIHKETIVATWETGEMDLGTRAYSKTLTFIGITGEKNF